ncbi:MAG: TPM domain-containing protein [Kiritimatiellae bacterium]|nr:TPM domain-containing protein [Kiritimatiellia bacterium]
MNFRPLLRTCVLLWVWAFGGACRAFSVAGTVPVPRLQGRINDLANLLTLDQRRRLEEKLLRFEERKGAQIAVLTVPTTKPETIEQYGVKVAESWKLGRKGVDDGALLLVASEDRAVRIEVGYGLEGILPDATAKRIIDESIIPCFRRGDFYGGIEAGIQRMIAVIEGESLPPPSLRVGQSPRVLDGVVPLVFFVVLLGSFLRVIIGRLPAALLGSSILAVVLWIATGSLGVVIVVALLMFVFLLAVGAQSGPVGAGRWSSGGWGGGVSGRGGGFGGGFSGGGGRFGGGGASGRW